VSLVIVIIFILLRGIALYYCIFRFNLLLSSSINLPGHCYQISIRVNSLRSQLSLSARLRRGFDLMHRLLKTVVEFSILRVNLDLRKFDLLDLEVQVAEPIIYILFVLILNTSKFVKAHIDSSEK
jgi:hypothetical protein